jgi:antitoxin component of RelBE/YafQ-DinJ toxin-antitoxin module
MVVRMSALLPDFPGAPNRSRCFAHILNLAARSIIRPFDLPKHQTNAALTEAAKELAKLGENLDVEEEESRKSAAEDAEDDAEDDDVEGWEDERTEEEKEGWDEDAMSVRFMLVKVR